MLFIRHLLDKFPVNDMGDASWYLGCTFKRDGVNGAIKMTQTTFIPSLVERFDIQYKWQTPLFVEFVLTRKRVIGSLLWISGRTRPYIASTVEAVARHAQNPPVRHWKAARLPSSRELRTQELCSGGEES